MGRDEARREVHIKFCIPHWDALRDEIENKRGLAQLVSRSGKEAVARITDPASPERNPLGETGDPLMDAHNMILGNAMKFLSEAGAPPMWIFTANEDGSEKCPLCVVSDCRDPECKNGCQKRGTEWIGFAGRDVAEMWADRLKAVTQ